MREILKENKYLIALCALCIAGLALFLGHYSEFLIDVGREIYYPERILQGDILYKDLFDIYGPLAYQFNAILYKLFGAKLSTLYGAGVVCSLLVVSGIYKLSSKYFSKFLSFALGIFTIAVGVTTTSIFNFHFPYSWVILYGLVAFIYSLYFIQDKNKLWLSALLAGICITCKYDFALYGFVILYLIIKNRDWKAFLCLITPPILSFGALFIQGLRFSDLMNSLNIVKNMAKSKTLIYFYQNSGIYFHPKALLTDFILFLKCAIPFGGILLGVEKNNKTITIISFILAVLFFNASSFFGFLPIALFIAIWFKNINLLTVSTLLVCAKVFWVLLLGSYGTYYVSILLIAVLSMIPRKFDKTVSIYLILLRIFVCFSNCTKHFTQPPYKIVEYVMANTQPTDKVVIFPEGMIINFLSGRESDGFYNSLLPLYVETFGEDNIIEHFHENKPEMIILNNRSMKDYYFEYICNDYAREFCEFVVENYKLQDVIDNGYKYTIFKKRM